MLKQKSKFNLKYLLSTIVVVGVFSAAAFYNTIAKADQFDQQIQALQDQNASTQQVSDSLALQASSYQDAVDKLSEQINTLQQQIVSTQQQATKSRRKLMKNRPSWTNSAKFWAKTSKRSIWKASISTLEILASSKDLSDFVDKEVDRTAVQDKVKDSVDQINALKVQLQQKQQQLQSLLKDQQNQQQQLQASQSQQAGLLAYTEQQKASYDQQIQANNATIASLRAQQLAANHALGGVPVAGDPNHGGYPAQWANAPQDSVLDSWGMLNRECVSYTAWKVYQTYGYMPYWGGVGNANQWPGDARGAGYLVDSNPAVHTVAISLAGGFGHAMWVEAVSGNTIYVSQYNYDLAGHYSEMSISASGLLFIHFHS